MNRQQLRAAVERRCESTPMTDDDLLARLATTIRRLCEDAYAGHPQPDWAKAIEADIVAEAAWRIEQQGRFRAKAHAWLGR